MTYTDININSAAYRLDQRRPQPTIAKRIAYLERSIDELAPFNWTASYKQMEVELAELKAQEAR